MNVVIFSATQGMGLAVARRMAERGDKLYLLGRNEKELELVSKDIVARSGKPIIGHGLCDMENPAGFSEVLNGAQAALGTIDTVIVTAAVFGTQEQFEQDLVFAAKLFTVNLTNTILFCEHARKVMLASGGGTLCVFSSVAGERGRKPVLLYGAAKAGLTRYLEGLDHKFRLQGLKTICVKPGFVKTRMTANLKAPPFAGEPDQVARIVIRAIDKGTPVVYAPPIWGLVMFVIRHLPRAIMRRINF